MKKRALTGVISVCMALVMLLPCFPIGENIFNSEAYANHVSGVDQEIRVVQLVNRARYEEGLEPLTILSELQNAADLRAFELETLYSHTRPDGSSCGTAIDESFPDNDVQGENIAKGQTSAEKVMKDWMNSPGHRANILNPDFAHIGVSYNTSCDAWVQEFVGHSCELGKTSVRYSKGWKFPVGTSVDDMEIIVECYCCDDYYTYFPLIDEYCAEYNPTKEGIQIFYVNLFGRDIEIRVSLTAEEQEEGSGETGELSGMCGEELYWKVDKAAGKLVITGTGDMWTHRTDVDTPYFYRTSDGNAYRAWDEAADYIKEVVLPDGLTGISENAFANLKKLRKIIIPDSVVSIGKSAFYCCKSLREVTLPDCITEVPNYLFSECTGLEEVYLGENTEVIGKEAFQNTYTLTKVTGLDNVKNIMENAFRNTNLGMCDSCGIRYYNGIALCFTYTGGDVKKFADGTRIITGGIFENSSITTVILPDSLKSIGEKAFYNCTKLVTVNFPDSLESIRMSAFEGCKNLVSVQLPDSVMKIYDYAFENSGLTSLKVSYDTEMGGSVFKNSNLSEIEVTGKPSGGLTTFTKDSFNGTPLLDDADSYVNGCLYIGDMLFAVKEDYSGEIRIKSGTKAIANAAGAYMDFTSLVISDSVKLIGSSAFYGCKKLKSVTFGNGIAEICDKAFCECTVLEKAVLPESLMTLGESVFYDCCRLTYVYLPKNLETVSKSDFSNCYHLKTVVLPEKLKSIGEHAFEYCKSLEQVTFPDSLVSIKEYAFYGDSFEEVYIPASVTEICDFAFCSGSAIDNYTLNEYFPAGRITAFRVAPKNKYYSADENGVLFNKDKTVLIAFPHITPKSYTLPETVEKIGAGAFYAYDNGYMTLHFNAGLKSIGSRAFYLSEFTHFEINAALASIAIDAFDACYYIESVTVAEGNRYFTADEYGNLYNKDRTRYVIFASNSPHSVYIAEPTLCDSISFTMENTVFADFSAGDYTGTTGTVCIEWSPVLESVTFPGSLFSSADYKWYTLEGIRHFQFMDCDSLEQITLTGEYNSLLIYALGGGGTSVPVYANYDDETADMLKADGVDYRKLCRVCQPVETERHIYCEKYGYVKYTCSVCGHNTYEELPVAGHNWNSGTVTKAATASDEGIKTFTCTVCSATKTESIPKLEPEGYFDGDIDGDGKISASDARLALRASVGIKGDKDKSGRTLDFTKKTSAGFLAADYDKNGKITSADARSILRVSVGLAP